MNPLLDQLLVALIVLGAIAYFGRLLLRRRAGGKGCGGGCGCSEAKAEKTLPQTPAE
ncbi:MAG: hypothetical protein QOE70_5217 [Chthoniobacter sp.]|jgi:hypothetical protein|nr:hypothetical protein [Chthoniobacter sp.]